MAMFPTPGVSVAVRGVDGVVHTAVFGDASNAAFDPAAAALSPSTLFLAGSVSKAVTALAYLASGMAESSLGVDIRPTVADLVCGDADHDDPAVPMRAFIAGVTRNVVREHRRTTFRWIRNLLRLASTRSGQCDGTGPENARAVTEVRELLDGLSDDQRIVFALAHFEDLTVPEIASGLGIPLDTAYSRLRGARIAFEKRVAARRAAERRPS